MSSKFPAFVSVSVWDLFLVAYHSNRCLVLCQFLGWLYGVLLNSKICPRQAGLTDCNGMWRQRKWGGLQSKSAMTMTALATTFQHWNIFGNQNAVGTWILESGWEQKNNICWSVWMMHRSEENCIPELWKRWSFQLAKSFIHQIGCDCFDFESTGNLCKLWRPDLVRTFSIHVESDRRGVSCQVFVFVFQEFDTSSMLVEIGKHKMKDDNTDVPNCYSQIKRFDQLIYFFICIYAYMHRDIYLASLDLTPVSE